MIEDKEVERAEDDPCPACHHGKLMLSALPPKSSPPFTRTLYCPECRWQTQVHNRAQFPPTDNRVHGSGVEPMDGVFIPPKPLGTFDPGPDKIVEVDDAGQARLIETPNGIENEVEAPTSVEKPWWQVVTQDMVALQTALNSPAMFRIAGTLIGQYGEDQRAIAALCQKITLTLLAKNRDYGSSVFKTPMLAPRCSPGDGILVRLSDKIERFQTLQKQPPEVASEAIEDTAMDAAAYFILWLVQREAEEKWPDFPYDESENRQCGTPSSSSPSAEKSGQSEAAGPFKKHYPMPPSLSNAKDAFPQP